MSQSINCSKSVCPSVLGIYYFLNLRSNEKDKDLVQTPTGQTHVFTPAAVAPPLSPPTNPIDSGETGCVVFFTLF